MPASAGQDTKLWLLRAGKAIAVFVYLVLLVDLVMLSLGFVLRLFGASIDAEFTQWVYRGVDRIMEPFRGMFPTHELSDQSVLDSSLLFAMIVYALAAIAFHTLVVWLTDKIVTIRRRQRVARPDAPPEGPVTTLAGASNAPAGFAPGNSPAGVAGPRSTYP